MEQDINDFMITLHDGLNYKKNLKLYNLQRNPFVHKFGDIIVILPNYFQWHRNCRIQI